MTKTLKQTPNGQSGFTLLELLLVIGVAALLLIGGIATYRLVSDGNKGTEATRLLLTIRQEAQTMAQQQNGTYSGLEFDSGSTNSASPLVTAGVLRDLQRNPFNGAIILDPVNNAATDDNLAVTFENISQSQCIKLAQSINNPAEIVTVAVNTNVIADSAVAAGGAGAFPVSVAAASGACTDAANTITWQFP